MALLTDNIDEARDAYSALELRARTAERNAAHLQATVTSLTSAHESLARSAGLLKEYAVVQAQDNARLRAQQAGQVSPDVMLDGFVASLGLAVALSEATMPDRAINSIQVTIQSYLTLSAGPDGVSKVAGIRLYQPELGGKAALATTSFEIRKVATTAGAPAPRNLYAVLQDKQAAFTDPFWGQFATGTPVSCPASQIVAEIAKTLAQAGQWSFPFVAQEAAVIAALEASLSALIGKAAATEALAAYVAAVGTLINLTKSLNPAARTGFVAGDLFALAAALDATTRAANTLRP
ncbi:MAG: hypothetical protein ABSH44_15020 [Bryobacteraceae bacterium]|jgi:hypothetical protein